MSSCWHCQPRTGMKTRSRHVPLAEPQVPADPVTPKAPLSPAATDGQRGRTLARLTARLAVAGPSQEHGSFERTWQAVR
jgi:hypothetical protein